MKGTIRGTVGKYILVKKKVIPCIELLTWAEWMEKADNRVAWTDVTENLWISTVFIGLDYNFAPQGPPRVFETAIFRSGTEHDENSVEIVGRWSTWEEAEEEHNQAVAKLRERRVNSAG